MNVSIYLFKRSVGDAEQVSVVGWKLGRVYFTADERRLRHWTTEQNCALCYRVRSVRYAVFSVRD